MTVVRIGMAPRLPHLTPTEFQDHWRTAHADAAGKMVGLRSYVQNHAILENGQPILPYPGFDACAELEFDSIEAHDAAFASTQYQGEVRKDEDRFIDKSKFSLVLAERKTMFDRGVPEDAVKLMIFWRLHPSSTIADLRDASTAWAAAAGTDTDILRHEQMLVRYEWHSEHQPCAADHVDTIWFDGVESAESHLRKQAFGIDLTLAGTVFGSASHLARARTVV